MTSASDEKWRPFNYFFSRVGLRTYQHPCIISDISSKHDIKTIATFSRQKFHRTGFFSLHYGLMDRIIYRIFQLYFESFECTTVKRGLVSFHFSIIWTVKPGTKMFSLSAIVMSFLAYRTVIKCLPDKRKSLQQIRYILKVSMWSGRLLASWMTREQN